MKVKCPNCKTIKTIDKTEKNIQVRCSKRERGCGERFYIKDNIVLEEKTNETKDKTIILNEPKIEDLTLGYDFNRHVIIEGLNDTIRIYKNSYVTREGSRVSKKNAAEGKKVLEWVERHENQLSVPLLVTYHPYFVKVLAAYQELKKLRG